jgi:superfamily I DNA/RNA helicase
MEFVPDREDPDRFWKVDVAELFMTAIETLPDRFDAVVVDEGQDFQPNWWLPLELINSGGDEGAMYVFYDPAQNLFVKEPGILPELGDAFRLPMNCRNTKKIAAVCGGILDVEVGTHPDAPEGLDPEFVEAKGTDAQQHGIASKLKEWLEDGRLAPSQIAILSPNRVSRSSMHGVERFGDVPVTNDVAAWKSGRGVLFSTIRAFKGLESDAVLMIDVPEPDSRKHFSSADYYVGASRAKHLLAVQRA